MNDLDIFLEEIRSTNNPFLYEINHNDLNFSSLDKNINYIYGAGEAAHWFYEIGVKTNKVKIEAFVDSNPTIKNYKEFKCINVDEFQKSILNKDNINIIVCNGSYPIFQMIKNNLAKFGFKNIYFHGYFFEIQYLFYQFESSKRKKNWGRIFTDNLKNIKIAFSFLEDDLSKEIFGDLLYSFYKKSAVNIKRSPRDEQYFPEDITLIDAKNFSKFLICGAYDGDLIRLINAKCNKVDHIIAIEPDHNIFQRLKEYVSKLDKTNTQFELIEKAVGGEICKKRFLTGSGLGSKVSNNGNIFVDTTTLDKLLTERGNIKIDLITMDIEGEELNALLGAHKYLKLNKTNLGVCAYHNPQHLWEIPLELKKINPNYKLFLRNYTSFITESVYYAC
jgi:FkbM family methyltransferase